MRATLGVLIKTMENDFYRNSTSVLQTANDFTDHLLIPAKALWRFKLEHTSSEHSESEDVEVFEAAHIHFERLEAEINENVIGPLLECAKGRPELESENFNEAVAAAQRIFGDISTIHMQLDRALYELAIKFSNRAIPTPKRAGKFVVSADLCKYGLISSTRDLDELFSMNQAIQKSIHKSIHASGASLESTIIEPTGDGAIVFFDTAEHALGFAWDLVSAAASISDQEIRQPEYRRYYRVGISYGLIKFQPYFHGGSPALNAHLAGTAIAIAVRIQAEAKDGAIWIENSIVDRAHMDQLPFRFGSEVNKILGKPHEVNLTVISVRALEGREPRKPQGGHASARD